MVRNITWVVLFATGFTGCTMAPHTELPEAPVAVHWPDVEVVQERGELVTWQQFFKSANMQTVIQQALEHNRDLRIATLSIDRAQALYRIKRGDLFPSVAATGAVARYHEQNNVNADGEKVVSTQYSVNLGVTAFELDFFGRIQSLKDEALEQYFATEEAKKSVEIALVAEVANSYLRYLTNKKLLELTENTLHAQETSFSLIEKRASLGVATELDLAQAATALEHVRAKKSHYIRSMAQAKNALTLLVGNAIDNAIFENEKLDDVVLMEMLPAGLPSELLLHRPDIREQEHALRAANAHIGAARAAFFPSITLTGSLGQSSNKLTNLFSSGTDFGWSFMPQLMQPIFEGGKLSANLEASKVEQKIAVARYEKAIQQAFREVADELAAQSTYKNEFEAQKALVAATERSYNLSQYSYKQGVVNYLNVLDAERAQYLAQEEQIMLELAMRTNLVTLYKVLGGGK